MSICTIDGCERKLLARGYCSLHYGRWRTHGDPLKVLAPGPKKITQPCAEDGCERTDIAAHGLCRAHYVAHNRAQKNYQPWVATCGDCGALLGVLAHQGASPWAAYDRHACIRRSA